MRLRLTSLLPCMVLAISFTACTDDKEAVEDSGPSCDSPMANAGVDASGTVGSAIQLDGSASSFCSEYADDVVFTWTFDQVPSESTVDSTALSDNDSNTAISPSFVPDVVGYYVLALTVTDPVESSAPSMVVIDVYVEDGRPVADCGPDQTGEVAVASTFDGSGSYDPEGGELEYSWSISQAPSCSDLDSTNIQNSASASPSVVPDCDGVYVVGLAVSDGAQWSDYSYCTLDVASENRVPVASAGETQDLGACANDPLTLNGNGSYDLDADPLTYQWSVVEVPATSAADDSNFEDATLASARFDWDVRGSYTFQLQVNDGEYWSAPDIVTLTINDESENTAPISNAGEDQELSSEAECTSSSYDWTCNDCKAVALELDGSGSYDPDGDAPTYYWSEPTGTMNFTNSHAALTDATILEQPAEYGVDSTVDLTVSFTVADCLESDVDSITVTYTCTGEAAE